MKTELRMRAAALAEKLERCGDDDRCAVCEEECGVCSGETLLEAARVLREMARGEKKSAEPWLHRAVEAGPERYDEVIDDGLKEIGDELMQIANRHKGDLPLVLTAMKVTLPSLERHLPEGTKKLMKWLLENTMAVDLTGFRG